MTVNVWNKWGTLREVMLGRSYAAEFYKDVKNPRIRSCLQRIADETEEDFLNFESVLKSYGVVVRRPELDPADSLLNYIEPNGEISQGSNPDTWYLGKPWVTNNLLPIPPMCPRDNFFILGNEVILTTPAHSTESAIIEKLVPKEEIVDFYKEYKVSVHAPTFTQIGIDVYVDTMEISAELEEKIKQRWPQLRWHQVRIGGHNDAVYHPFKPGAIMSLFNVQQYQETFPGWDVLYLPDASWSAASPFLQLKDKNQGRWWLPGEENNDEFTGFVERYLGHWVGYVEETVFDINSLMINENTICVNRYNEQAFEFFKKHKVEPIVVPFRHRWFWDGGLHCITLDTLRDGGPEDYFADVAQR